MLTFESAATQGSAAIIEKLAVRPTSLDHSYPSTVI
jgi:hypothetical protein